MATTRTAPRACTACCTASCRPLARAVWRPTGDAGLEHVPATGGVILASNHLSFADSVVIPCVVPRKVVFLAKSDYFTGTGVRGALQRAWFEGLGMLPVDRDDTKAGAGQPRHRAGGAGAGGGVRHLPRGHPLARRPALPRPHRRRAPRADRRRARSCPSGCGAPRSSSRSGSNLPRIVPVEVDVRRRRSRSPAASTACRRPGPPRGHRRDHGRDRRRSPARSRPASTTSAPRRPERP